MMLLLQLTIYRFMVRRDFPALNPGEIASVSILRDGQTLEFELEVMASPDDPERGLIGIMRDNSIPYKPVMNFIDWTNVDFNISMFLLWLWMISFFIGIINMLPLPILDGGKFIYIIIDKRVSEKSVNGIMWGNLWFYFCIVWIKHCLIIYEVWLVYYLRVLKNN